MIRPGFICILYTKCDNKNAVPQLHLLALCLASIKSQPESSTQLTSEDHAREPHQTSHGDAYSAEHTMAMSAISSGIGLSQNRTTHVLFTQIYYALPTT